VKKALAIVAVILVLDFLTKHIIRTYLHLHQVIPLTSFLNIVHVQNTGAAFGMFSGLGRLVFILIALVASAGVVFFMMRVPEYRSVLAMILGGALGNLMDRVFRGHVTDFVDFHIGNLHWPAFNVADSALTLSVLFLLYTSFRKSPEATGNADNNTQA